MRATAEANTPAPRAAPCALPRLLAVALAAVTLAAYGVGVLNGFVWDDHQIIVNNPINRDLANIRQVLFDADVVFADDVADYYRPLNRLTYLFEYQLFGLRPAGYHLVNILIHLGNVLLLFVLGQRLFREPLAAFVSALLLGIHPITTEAVNFISGRNNILASLFTLATVILFLQGEETNGRRRFLLAGGSFFCGLLTKEIAVMTLPFLLLRPSFLSTETVWATLRRRAVALIPCGIGLLLYLTLRTAALPAMVSSAGVPDLWTRLAQNLYGLPAYAALILLPAGLKVYHEIPAGYLTRWPALVPGWLAIISGVVFLLRRRSLPVLWGLLWFGANYVPISHLVPFTSSPVAERYIYLPAIGIWLLAGAGVDWFYDQRRGRQFLTPGLILLALALALPTWLRTREWRDDFSLFSALVRVDPASVNGHYNLGGIYQERGDLAKAQEHWQRTVEIAPRHSQALSQLGSVALVEGRLPEAEQYFAQAVAAGPDNAEARYNLAMLLDQSGRQGEALTHYEHFLQRVPPEYRQLIPKVQARLRVLRQEGP